MPPTIGTLPDDGIPAGDYDLEAEVAEYLVIVHGTGRLEHSSAAAFWTEVPALSACMSEGAAVVEVLARTEAAINDWRNRSRYPTRPIRIIPELAL